MQDVTREVDPDSHLSSVMEESDQQAAAESQRDAASETRRTGSVASTSAPTKRRGPKLTVTMPAPKIVRPTRPSPAQLREDDPMFLPALTDEDLAMDMPGHKSGYVAVIGRPNAGKSTLINSVSSRIVSPAMLTALPSLVHDQCTA